MQRNYQLKIDGERSPEAARERLFALGRRKCFDDGQTIWQQGDAADGFYAVVSGSVRTSRAGADGSRSVFGVIGAGDLVGEAAYVTRTRRAATLEAIGKSELLWFGDSVFRESIATDCALLMFVLRSVSYQFQQTLHMVDQARRLSATDRLAIVLRSFRTGPDGVVHATHQELADMVGVSRVSLGSALGRLAQSGAIERSYGHVRILDRAALESRTAPHRAA